MKFLNGLKEVFLTIVALWVVWNFVVYIFGVLIG